MTIEEKYKKIIEYFQIYQPVAQTELHYRNPYELIVAVILSAQCTDKRVNLITPEFFKFFPSPKELYNSNVETIFDLIKSCSFPNNKAKHLHGMSKILVEEFNCIIPSDIEKLQKLPGVGRKTANVIISVVFNKPAMAVDTHVFRVSARLGLTENSKNPLETERQLIKYFPDNLLPIAHHWLILHGRYICVSRKPKCENCGISEYCNFFNQSELEFNNVKTKIKTKKK